MPKAKASKQMVRLTFSADPDDYQKVEELARLEDRSVASLLRRAMRDLIEKKNNAKEAR